LIIYINLPFFFFYAKIKREKIANTKMLKYILIIFLLGSAFLLWFSVDQATDSSGSERWLVPIACFAFYFIVVCLSFLVIKEKYLLALILFLSFFISFIFTWNWAHIFPLAAGFILTLSAIFSVKKDMDSRIKITPYGSLRAGSYLLVLAIGLVISSQYYAKAKEASIDEMITRLQRGAGFQYIFEKIIPYFIPSMNLDDGEDITIDQFILETVKREASGSAFTPDFLSRQIGDEIDKNLGGTVGDEKKDALASGLLVQTGMIAEELTKQEEGIILEQGRANFSKLLAKPVAGSEKMKDIFPLLVSRKINELLRMNSGSGGGVFIIPLILSLILFLVIIPIGSLLSYLVLLIVMAIFYILLKLGAVRLEKIPTEAERIE
jgi:hypothetical protein